MQRRSTISRLVVTLVILAVLLFVPAGRITWTRGWIFLLFFTLLMTASFIYFTRANPEMFALLTHGIGLFALGVAGILMVLGWLWMRKIVKSVAL